MKTGHTVITREAEWDEQSRGRAMRLAEYESSLCPCGCGVTQAVAHDPDQLMRVESFVCAARRALAVKERMDRDEHKKDTRPGWDDGLYYHVVPHNED